MNKAMTKDEIKILIEAGLPGAKARVLGDDGQHFEAEVVFDGFRHGFLGVGDAPVWLCFASTGALFAVLSAACLAMLSSGYRLRP